MDAISPNINLIKVIETTSVIQRYPSSSIFSLYVELMKFLPAWKRVLIAGCQWQLPAKPLYLSAISTTYHTVYSYWYIMIRYISLCSLVCDWHNKEIWHCRQAGRDRRGIHWKKRLVTELGKLMEDKRTDWSHVSRK